MPDLSGKRFVAIWMLIGAACVLSLLSISPAAAADSKSAAFAGRIYGRLGYLVVSPSPEDMGYTVVGGGESKFSSTSKVNPDLLT